MLAELAMEAGLPDGVLNIVHGTNVGYVETFCTILHSLFFFRHLKIFIYTCQDTVNAICDDEDIRAVSFVGSNTVSIYNFFVALQNLLTRTYGCIVLFKRLECIYMQEQQPKANVFR